MPKEHLPKAYNPKEVEKQIYTRWEESGFFNPDTLPAERYKNAEPYVAMLPPPNVTGSLHMGHALNATIQDILIRKKRMEGRRTLWLPGTDHAGIATQNVVEKKLKKEGVSRHDLGKEKFLDEVWKWKEEYGNIILEQLKKIGVSCDWSRARFTMDEAYQEEVRTAFLHYHKKGWIYQGERVINWCVRCQTSISDLEIEREEEETALYYIKYPIKDSNAYITVATVRPETMLGDAAVAVHPDDPRYGTFINKTALLPIQHREIPIIADRAIEKEFGTGAIKVTPAHDLADADIGERHKLPFYKIIDERGRMTKEAGSICEGLKINECREKVVQELKKEGLIEKEEPYVHNITVCYRCGSIIEPLMSKQWFLKMDKLAEYARNAVSSGKVVFYPKRWEKVYMDWLDNIRDWCISRQLWWGHQIPLPGETDVLDTWFSSALWPYATLEGKDRDTFYPGHVLVTARDIINLWVARMVYSGKEFMHEEPFRDVIIHATILTRDGQRMSKSLGTGVDPMDLIATYGADATRFGLVWQAMGGQDIHWSEEHVRAGKKFVNKLWNASKFVLAQVEHSDLQFPVNVSKIPPALSTPIVEEFQRVRASTNVLIDNYEFGQALHEIYEFFWHTFCDKTLEESKRSDIKNKDAVAETLLYVLGSSLVLLHPFIPFVTERIWELVPKKDDTMLIVTPWDISL